MGRPPHGAAGRHRKSSGPGRAAAALASMLVFLLRTVAHLGTAAPGAYVRVHRDAVPRTLWCGAHACLGTWTHQRLEQSTRCSPILHDGATRMKVECLALVAWRASLVQLPVQLPVHMHTAGATASAHPFA